MSRKTIIMAILAFIMFLFCGCNKQLSLEEKAAQDAKEYNRRYCPTPAINDIRTDSINFDPRGHIFTYNCSFSGKLDDPLVVDLNKKLILKILTSSIKESTSMKTYVEAGFHFKYVCRSDKNPDLVLFVTAF